MLVCCFHKLLNQSNGKPRLSCNDYELIKTTGHINKTLGIHPNPMPKLGSYCIYIVYDHNLVR